MTPVRAFHNTTAPKISPAERLHDLNSPVIVRVKYTCNPTRSLHQPALHRRAQNPRWLHKNVKSAYINTLFWHTRAPVYTQIDAIRVPPHSGVRQNTDIKPIYVPVTMAKLIYRNQFPGSWRREALWSGMLMEWPGCSRRWEEFN